MLVVSREYWVGMLLNTPTTKNSPAQLSVVRSASYALQSSVFISSLMFLRF